MIEKVEELLERKRKSFHGKLTKLFAPSNPYLAAKSLLSDVEEFLTESNMVDVLRLIDELREIFKTYPMLVLAQFQEFIILCPNGHYANNKEVYRRFEPYNFYYHKIYDFLLEVEEIFFNLPDLGSIFNLVNMFDVDEQDSIKEINKKAIGIYLLKFLIEDGILKDLEQFVPLLKRILFDMLNAFHKIKGFILYLEKKKVYLRETYEEMKALYRPLYGGMKIVDKVNDILHKLRDLLQGKDKKSSLPLTLFEQDEVNKITERIQEILFLRV